MANQDINLTSYDPDAAKIQRQQRLADMLQQQSMEAIPINSYNGIQAPISPFSVLAKALQGYSARKNQEKADQGAQAYRDKDAQSAQALIAAMNKKTGGIASMPTTVDGTLPQLPGQAPPQPQPQPQGPQAQGPQPGMPPAQPPQPQGPQAQIQVGGQAPQGPSMQDQLAAILSAHGGPQTQMIQQAMLPQIMQRQNLDYQHKLGREDKAFDNSQPMSTAMGQQIAAQSAAAQRNAQFTNQLPQTANERAVNALGRDQLNKPQFVPYGAPGYMQGSKFTALPGAGGAGSSPFGLGDETSPSLNGQLGMSTNALNLLTGNTAAVAKGRPMDLASREVDEVIKRRGLDPSVVKPRVQAYSDAVKMNTLKSNTMDTLSRELSGTVENISPIADKLGGGDLRWTKEGVQFVGGLANDPNSQQYAFYLNQLRADLAGFNAVSGGKIGLHGQVMTDNADFAVAERVIKDGLSSGGARGLATAIEATRQKNVGIVEKQSVEAQRGIWQALGLGPQFDKIHGQPEPATGGGGGTTKFHYDKSGNRVPG